MEKDKIDQVECWEFFDKAYNEMKVSNENIDNINSNTKLNKPKTVIEYPYTANKSNTILNFDERVQPKNITDYSVEDIITHNNN